MVRRNKTVKQFLERRRAKVISTRKSSPPSHPEKEIMAFLIANCVEFKREYFFKGCVNRASKVHLFFDFYLPEYNLAIEYDGKHHTHPIYGIDKLLKIQDHDFKKNVFCSLSRIHLLRIPYTERKNLESLILKKIDAISPIRPK